MSATQSAPTQAAPMQAAQMPAAILETIVFHLAALFLAGAGGDIDAARDAARHMILAYHPETEAELRLAANLISHSFQSLEALGQAATLDMPLSRVMRLRGSAVSLSRESHKAEHRLQQLQKARREGIPAHPVATQSHLAQSESAQPRIENAVALIQDTRKVADTAKASGQTWTRAYEARQRDLRIAASIKRAEAKAAAQPNPAMVATSPDRNSATMATAG